MKNKEIMKTLLDSVDVVNLEYLTQMSSVCVAAKLKPWNI